MKKKLVKGLVICGMIGIGFTALGTNVEAATYYGNGVYCNKQKCWVNWGQAWSE
ncbi:bacteriocin, partial [Enterococcus faecalis]|nr:bacteriocin [Enterococcus faecalis]